MTDRLSQERFPCGSGALARGEGFRDAAPVRENGLSSGFTRAVCPRASRVSSAPWPRPDSRRRRVYGGPGPRAGFPHHSTFCLFPLWLIIDSGPPPSAPRARARRKKTRRPRSRRQLRRNAPQRPINTGLSPRPRRFARSRRAPASPLKAAVPTALASKSLEGVARARRGGGVGEGG